LSTLVDLLTFFFLWKSCASHGAAVKAASPPANTRMVNLFAVLSVSAWRKRSPLQGNVCDRFAVLLATNRAAIPEGLGHPGLLGSAETQVDFSIPEPKGRSSRKCPDGQGQAALWDAGRSGLGLPRSGGDRAPSKVLIWPNQFAFPSSGRAANVTHCSLKRGSEILNKLLQCTAALTLNYPGSRDEGESPTEKWISANFSLSRFQD
jgi:hypothetical protein